MSGSGGIDDGGVLSVGGRGLIVAERVEIQYECPQAW